MTQQTVSQDTATSGNTVSLSTLPPADRGAETIRAAPPNAALTTPLPAVPVMPPAVPTTQQTVSIAPPAAAITLPAVAIAPPADAQTASAALIAEVHAQAQTQTCAETVGLNLPKATEAQWKMYHANNEWIRFADVKAGALLTANGALLAAAISALKNNADALAAHPLALALTLCSGAGLLISVGYSLWCISPKTGPFHAIHDAKTVSPLFFEHVAEMEIDAYRARAQEMGGEEAAFAHISQQVWINARVARTKHRQVTLAIRAFAVCIACALLAALLLSFR